MKNVDLKNEGNNINTVLAPVFPCKIKVNDDEYTSQEICQAFGFAHSEFMFRVAIMQMKERHAKVSERYLQIGANTMLATVAQDFIDWRDKLHSEIRGGKLMFDVPRHYKWLDETELFTYYMDSGRYCG